MAARQAVPSILCVAAAFVVTFVVAALAAYFSKPIYTQPQFVAERSARVRDFWLVHRAQSWGVSYIAYEPSHALGHILAEGRVAALRQIDPHVAPSSNLSVLDGFRATPNWAPPPSQPDLKPNQVRISMAAGWPLPCASATAVATLPQQLSTPPFRLSASARATSPPPAPPLHTALASAQWASALTLGRLYYSPLPYVLPLQIIPLPFALNVSAYSLVNLLIFYSGRLLQFGWRRLHGRCPKCSYPATPALGCCECGWHRGAA